MIHLYDIGNSDFDKFGDVILKPLSGNVRQAAGGGYDLSMEVPIDAEGAWAHIVPGAIVKVPVPKETIKNAFAGLEADIYKTNDEAILREGPSEPTQITYQAWSISAEYAVGTKVTYASQNYKCNYYDETSPYAHISPPNCNWWGKIANRTEGSAALCTLKAGTELYFVEAYDETWYKMSTFYGIVGYVKINQLTYDRHVTPSEITDHVITDQLFRLREPTVNTEKNTVSVAGQHVSYDLAGILVKDINISQAAPAMAISHIVGAFMMDYAGEIATDMVDDDNGTFTGEIKGKNGIYALLDPDNGIVGQFDAKLTRDNWDIFVMKKPEADPVCSIAYGKNVRGITWKRSSNDLITRIVPVAKNEAGEDLYLPEQWVDSELISDYPVIIMERLNVQGQVGKAKSEEDETTWTESDLLDEMRTKAGERFSVDKVDQIKVEVTVQLEQLGASPEYEWLKKLESLLLYDKVVVQDRRIGLSVTVDAVEIEYDIVKQKVTGLKLSNADYVNGSSIAGYNVKNHSITADKLVPGLADQIVSRAVGTVPEFAQPFDQTTHMNSASQDGLVKKGNGNGNKVWGTDANGNPDWISPPATSVTDNDPTLAWGTRSNVGTVGSTDLHVTMPDEPAEMEIIKSKTDITQTKTSYNLDSGKDLSNYRLILFCFEENGYIRESRILPTAYFRASSGAIIWYYSGSKNIEVDILPKSSTSVYMQYASTSTLTNPKVEIYGIK